MNNSKDVTINNLKKKHGIKRSCNFFSVDFNLINSNNIIDIHKNLT